MLNTITRLNRLKCENVFYQSVCMLNYETKG